MFKNDLETRVAFTNAEAIVGIGLITIGTALLVTEYSPDVSIFSKEGYNMLSWTTFILGSLYTGVSIANYNKLITERQSDIKQ